MQLLGVGAGPPTQLTATVGKRLLGAVCAFAVAAAPLQASAADPLGLHMRAAVADPVTPQSAADARTPLQTQAKSMHDGGDDVGAANMLMREAQRLKDPVLYLDAADAFLAVAEANADLQWLDGAQQMADIALDMLLFLQDNGGSENWKPVAEEHVGMVLERAQGFEARLQSSKSNIEAQLEAEQAEPEGPVAPPKAKSGKGLFIAGAALTGVGVLGLGAAGAGMAIGAMAQRDVTDPLVYEQEHEAAEARGRTGNLLAYAGGGLAVVGIGAGVALMVVAKKRDKQRPTEPNPADSGDTEAADANDDADDPTVAVIPGFRGLTIKGTF